MERTARLIRNEAKEEDTQDGKKRCCPICARKTRVNAADEKLQITTTQGTMTIPRDWFVCRPCGTGFSPVDTALGIEEIGHKVYSAQSCVVILFWRIASPRVIQSVWPDEL